MEIFFRQTKAYPPYGGKGFNQFLIPVENGKFAQPLQQTFAGLPGVGILLFWCGRGEQQGLPVDGHLLCTFRGTVEKGGGIAAIKNFRTAFGSSLINGQDTLQQLLPAFQRLEAGGHAFAVSHATLE